MKGKGKKKNAAAPATADKPKICFTYLKKGKCRKGDSCPYAHDDTARKEKESKKRKREGALGAEKAASVPRPEGCTTLRVTVDGTDIKRSVVEKGFKEIQVTGVKKVKSINDDGGFDVSFKSEDECGDAFIIASNSGNFDFGRRIKVEYVA